MWIERFAFCSQLSTFHLATSYLLTIMSNLSYKFNYYMAQMVGVLWLVDYWSITFRYGQQRRLLYCACARNFTFNAREAARRSLAVFEAARYFGEWKLGAHTQQSTIDVSFSFRYNLRRRRPGWKCHISGICGKSRLPLWTHHGWKQQQKFDVAIKRYFSISRHCMKSVCVWIC